MNRPDTTLTDHDAFTFRLGMCESALIELIDHHSPDDAAPGFAYERANQLGDTPGLAS